MTDELVGADPFGADPFGAEALGAGALGAGLFGAGLSLARQYADLLGSSGVERGLVGPREVPRIWDRHILNCAVLAPELPDGARIADVGSGAGLPGIVLAIARPDVAVTLIEPLLRRVTWLDEAVADLRLANVTVRRCRAEHVPAADRGFDVVTARAVAALPKLLAWCLPLARPGGVVLALKGESVEAEVEAAEPALRTLGARSWTVQEFGRGLVDPPTRVVRVVAGSHPVTPGSGAVRSGSRESRRGRR